MRAWELLGASKLPCFPFVGESPQAEIGILAAGKQPEDTGSGKGQRAAGRDLQGLLCLIASSDKILLCAELI